MLSLTPRRAASILLKLVAVSSIAAAAARANGAFPDEFSVNFPPNAPHTILVGANFGLLVSTDDGASWRYSCEPYVTTGSTAPLSSFNVGHYDVKVRRRGEGLELVGKWITLDAWTLAPYGAVSIIL